MLNEVAGRSATAPRETKAAERALGEVERLNARLSATFASLTDLRERVSGARPPSGGAIEAATSFALGGFVGGVGQSLERAQITLTQIDEVIQELADVV